MERSFKILAINLGSTSSKIGAWENEKNIFLQSVQHSAEDLQVFKTIWDQKDYRLSEIRETLQKHGLSFEGFDIYVSRGGNVRPIPGGIYCITQEMLSEMKSGKYGIHPTAIGNSIAHELGETYGKPAIFVDAPVTDELCPEARLTGIPEITVQSSFHALNQKATARKIASDLGKPYTQTRMIICHMGGGISIGAHCMGKVIDVNNALDGDGPISPERAGTIPSGSLVDMCFSQTFSYSEMRSKLTGKGGWVALLGTSNGREVITRIQAGDEKACLVLNATVYQIAKSIGAMAAVLKGDVDAIGLTGSLAHTELIVEKLREQVGFIAPFYLCPGENEMEALCAGALRYLRGEELPAPF